MNDNGDRLADFCLNNSCIIRGTIFPHKDIHKLTGRSPGRRTVNQIDHLIINSKWRRSLQDVRACCEANINNDHYLIVATIKLKLRSSKRKREVCQLFDIDKLKTNVVNKNFMLEGRNRVNALALTSDDEDEDEVEKKWRAIKDAYVEAAKKVIGSRKKKNNEWLSAETWNLIEERKRLKEKLLTTKSPRLLEQVEAAYRAKDMEVKKSARQDKSAFIDEMAKKAKQRQQEVK